MRARHLSNGFYLQGFGLHWQALLYHPELLQRQHEYHRAECQPDD